MAFGHGGKLVTKKGARKRRSAKRVRDAYAKRVKATEAFKSAALQRGGPDALDVR